MKGGERYPYDSKIVYDNLSPEDPIRIEMEKLISKIENIVCPYLI